MTVKQKKGVLIFMKFKRIYDIKTRHIYLFLVISLFFIGISMITMFNASDRETNQDFFSDMGNPKSSLEFSLDYNEYVTVYSTSGSGDRLHWSFSGTNNFVGITVRVVDSLNYAKLQSNETYSYEVLSDGSYYSAEGDYYPASSSTWYFLFMNIDPDQQTTYLTYDVTTHPGGPDILLIVIIVSVVAAAVVVVIVVIIRYRKKSRRQAESKQEPIVKPVVEKPPIITQPVKPVVEKPPIITQPVKPIVEKPPIIIPPVKPVGATQPTITEPVKQIIRKANICPTCGSEVESHFCIKCGIDIHKPELERKKVIQDIQKVFQASGIRIDLEMLRDILPMDDSEFNRKISELAERFGFKIELEILHINKEMKEDFINALIDALKA